MQRRGSGKLEEENNKRKSLGGNVLQGSGEQQRGQCGWSRRRELRVVEKLKSWARPWGQVGHRKNCDFHELACGGYCLCHNLQPYLFLVTDRLLLLGSVVATHPKPGQLEPFPRILSTRIGPEEVIILFLVTICLDINQSCLWPVFHPPKNLELEE